MHNVSARAVRQAVTLICLLLLTRSPAAPSLENPEESSLVIAVAGDVLPQSPHRTFPDAKHAFDGVQEEFASADLVFINLEEPVTRSNQVTPHKNPEAVRAGLDYILRTRDLLFPEALKHAGVSLVGLANNHMLDYRVEGLEDTLRGLRRAGLPEVGAGLKPQAERAYICSKGGVRVALLAFTDVVPPQTQATNHRPGVASSKNLADLNNAVWRAHQQADFVVLMIHWGGQGNHSITKRQQEVARAAVRAGCDVVVGMHPHVLQGIQYMGRVPVFYSIGNFAYPSTGQDNSECILVKLTFVPKQLESVDIVPIEIARDGAPETVTGERAEKIFSRLDRYCRMFNTRIEGGRIMSSAVRERLVYDTSTRSERRKQRARSETESGP